MRKLVIIASTGLIVILTVVFLVPFILNNEDAEAKPFYIGVNYTGNSTSAAKLLIERVKNYTNLFVIQSLSFGRNETALTEICDYAVAQNLSVIVNLLNAAHVNSSLLIWQLPFLENAEQRWGTQFLGVYFDDEPGGIQLDYDWSSFFAQPHSAGFARLLPDLDPNDNESASRDYSTAARLFTNIVQYNLRPDKWKNAGVKSFTSDYGLYWWDYLGGYDVLLAQLGWNHTMEQDIALVRGAARMQNKSWGTILTWKYDKPPYIDSGDNIYQQVLMSYQAGAQYTVLFNYPQIEGNLYGGILENEHFEALERFWNDVMVEPNRQEDSDYGEAVLVLPSNYGWGMRHQNDRIWGFWGPDEKSPQIWELSRKLLLQYGIGLDIVYEDPDFPVEGTYPKIYYWNQTIQP